MFGLQETAVGRWKLRFRLRLSFFRARTLTKSESYLIESLANSPIESSANLGNSFLAAKCTMVRKLHNKWNFGVVATMNRDAFPAAALRSRVLKFWYKLLYLDKILVVVFVLE